MKKLLLNSAGQAMLLILIWLAVAALGIVFVNVAIQTKSRTNFVKKWPHVTGVIKTAAMEESRNCGAKESKFSPAIVYEYEVEKEKYEGKRVLLTDGPFQDVSEIENGVRASVLAARDEWTDKEWRAGEPVEVYYSPHFPKDSILHIYSPANYQKYYFLGVVALIFGIFMCGRCAIEEF